MAEPTHGPIEADQYELMNTLAETLDEIFNGPFLPGLPKNRKIGFVLLTAKFGEIDNGRVNYISNGERDDMTCMMKELLARWEGRYDEEEPGKVN